MSYGASQAGAVLSYRINPAFRAYVRASQALVPGGESEGALGLSVHPFDELPVAAHAEGRITRRESGTELRPSAFFADGLDEIELPFAIKGHIYAQAGYVGGEYATGFIDGTARV